jgi:hypothetical protein
MWQFDTQAQCRNPGIECLEYCAKASSVANVNEEHPFTAFILSGPLGMKGGNFINSMDLTG